MMSQTSDKDGASSDKSVTVSPSPAHQALKNTLGVRDADGTLTLNKKKSWLGSLRDAVQKGALQAKAAVDSLRQDPNKSEHKLLPKDLTEAAAQPRPSTDSITPSIPSSEFSASRLQSLSPKTARASFRHQPAHHSVKSHRKRNSIFSVTSRSSNEVSRPITLPRPDSPQQEGSKRKSSMASSIVGSIRGLGRRKETTPQPPSEQDNPASPDKLRVAENVPLPSSPIDIPSAAPALDLDLGPAGIMFDCSSETARVKEALRWTDPANITTGMPVSYHIHVTDESSVVPQFEVGPTSPAQVLRLELGPTTLSSFSPAPGPPTPMPGTNLPLELDGANSDESDRSHVFERSVGLQDPQRRKALQRMCSLDAMAEACAIAHANDDVMTETESADALPATEDSTTKLQIQSSEYLLDVPQQATMSTITVTSCPSDMEEISRQQHQELNSDISSRTRLDWVEEDPCDPTKDLGIGPPSTTRSVTLPFRPRSNSVLGHMQSETATHGHVTLEASADSIIGNHKAPPNSPTAPEHAAFTIMRNDFIAEPGAHTDILSAESQHSDDVETEERSIFDHDTPLRTQQLLAAGIIFSDDDDNQDSPLPEGLSPHGGPLVPRLYQGIETSPETSRTTYTAGLGDTEYRFHFDDWIKSTSATASALPEEPRTPRHRSMDASIDSFSTVADRPTPQISPRSSNMERTPSMGNRVDFDLKRSQRNMRYNALLQDYAEEQQVEGDAFLKHPDSDIILHNSTPLSAGGSQHDGEDKVETRLPRRDSPQSPILHAALKEAEDELQDALNVRTDPAESSAKLACSSPTDHSTSVEPANRTHDGFVRQTANVLSSRDLSLPVPRPPRNAQSSPIRSTALTVLNPLGPPSPPNAAEIPRRNISELSQSSAGSPLPWFGSRVASADTLDSSLDLFNSPDSGYQADKSSANSGEKVRAGSWKGYRSLGTRTGASRLFGDLAKPSP